MRTSPFRSSPLRLIVRGRPEVTPRLGRGRLGSDTGGGTSARGPAGAPPESEDQQDDHAHPYQDQKQGGRTIGGEGPGGDAGNRHGGVLSFENGSNRLVSAQERIKPSGFRSHPASVHSARLQGRSGPGQARRGPHRLPGPREVGA